MDLDLKFHVYVNAVSKYFLYHRPTMQGCFYFLEAKFRNPELRGSSRTSALYTCTGTPYGQRILDRLSTIYRKRCEIRCKWLLAHMSIPLVQIFLTSNDTESCNGRHFFVTSAKLVDFGSTMSNFKFQRQIEARPILSVKVKGKVNNWIYIALWQVCVQKSSFPNYWERVP